MQFTKKNLLSLLKENIEEMAMSFDTPDRPDQGLQDKLSQGDTPLKKIPFPNAEQPNNNFQELLASERYKQVIARVREYTGINTPLTGGNNIMPLAQMMMTAHNQIIQTERAHREQLEQLAIELVMKEMGIPEGALQFNAKIVGMGEIDMSGFNREMGQQPNIEPVDIETDLMDDLESVNLEKAKRRLINSMVQGASKRGHYMYHYVAEKIEEITGSEDLINQYGILMSINDTLYWQLSDDTMKQMMGGADGGGSAGGSEEVDRNTDPPTIVARGINFPILVHELIKGVMELFAIQGRPTDDEGNEDPRWSEIEQSEDTLEKEIWDLRLGPSIWDRIRKQFPESILTDESKIELQNYLIQSIFKLPAKEFLVFMKEVISGSENGKRLMNGLMSGIDQMFRDQDYQDAINTFNDDLTDVVEDTDNDDLKDFLNGLNIKLSDDGLDDLLGPGIRRPDDDNQ
jgi:hypothetical protein